MSIACRSYTGLIRFVVSLYSENSQDFTSRTARRKWDVRTKDYGTASGQVTDKSAEILTEIRRRQRQREGRKTAVQSNLDYPHLSAKQLCRCRDGIRSPTFDIVN